MVCYCVDTLDTKKQKVMQFIQGVIMLALGRPNDTVARWSKLSTRVPNLVPFHPI